jgi:hypothetical protein
MAKAKEASADTGFESDVGVEDDDNVVIDFGGVEELKFEAIPQGWYNGIILSMEYKRSQSKNQPMWELRLQVGEGDYQGRTFWNYVSFSEKALPGTKLFISQVMPELLDQPLNPRQAAEDAVLVGIPVRFQLGTEFYEGKKRNRVKRVEAAAAGNAFMGG